MHRLRNENDLKRLKDALTLQDVTFRNTDGDTAEVSYTSVGPGRMKYYLHFNGKLINTFIHFGWMVKALRKVMGIPDYSWRNTFLSKLDDNDRKYWEKALTDDPEVRGLFMRCENAGQFFRVTAGYFHSRKAVAEQMLTDAMLNSMKPAVFQIPEGSEFIRKKEDK